MRGEIVSSLQVAASVLQTKTPPPSRHPHHNTNTLHSQQTRHPAINSQQAERDTQFMPITVDCPQLVTGTLLNGRAPVKHCQVN